MRIVFLNWRDTSNPEGGGSEVYVETIAEGLVRRGHTVTIGCAEHVRGAPAEERRGVHIRRSGTKFGVYARAAAALRRGDFGPVDVVVDVQNGIPFCSPFVTSAPVVVLVHHVHREQWPVIYGPMRSRLGWFIESRLAPRIYRSASYVAVSERTRDELGTLGIDRTRIDVIHNGTHGCPPSMRPRAATPLVLVLGRLVPHKRVEHVLEDAARMKGTVPGLRVAVVGDGWWRPELDAHVDRLGLSDLVDFYGHVDEETKDHMLRAAWVLALPSLKEGWGLVVMEAAARGVPTVAYLEAGGVAESVVHGQTGLLASSRPEFGAYLERLLTDEGLRQQLGSRAREHALTFDWERSIDAFEDHLRRRVAERDRAVNARRRSGDAVDHSVP